MDMIYKDKTCHLENMFHIRKLVRKNIYMKNNNKIQPTLHLYTISSKGTVLLLLFYNIVGV